jgi:peptidoglycan glycosyltransferase
MESPRKLRIQHLTIGLLVGYLLVAAALAYWSVGRGSGLAERPDNPRGVEEELRIRRGRILSRSDVVLAETVGPEENPARVYPVPNIGPAVGYYSFRHGTAGVEEGYDAVLRGDSDEMWETFRRRLLHEAQTGRDIRLTLDVTWQRAAEAVLGERQGAIVLLTLPEGAIAALASHPTYDPNRLDEQFAELVADEDAPLLNRASQGQYQPGLALQPFILAAAVEQGLVRLNEAVESPDEEVMVHGQPRNCASEPPAGATWADVLAHACPSPMLSLAQPLTDEALTSIFSAFGFTAPPEVPLNVAAVAEDPVVALDAAVIGQNTLTVTPLQVARAWAALANDGVLPSLQLVTAVEGESGEWEAVRADGAAGEAVSAAAASAVLDALPRAEGYREYATLALAGPAGHTNGWYLGLAPAGDPRYAVVVVLENSDSVSEAQRVGRALLRVVLGS